MQFVLNTAPWMPEYVPSGHVLHTVSLVAPMSVGKAYFPDGHREQVALLCCPVAEEYVPALQGLHCARPSSSANDPAGQMVHADLLFGAESEKKYPLAHIEHEDEPMLAVSEPAGHGAHEEPFMLALRKVLKTQSVHAEAPKVDENLPRGHCTQAWDPLNCE